MTIYVWKQQNMIYVLYVLKPYNWKGYNISESQSCHFTHLWTWVQSSIDLKRSVWWRSIERLCPKKREDEERHRPRLVLTTRIYHDNPNIFFVYVWFMIHEVSKGGCHACTCVCDQPELIIQHCVVSCRSGRQMLHTLKCASATQKHVWKHEETKWRRCTSRKKRY